MLLHDDVVTNREAKASAFSGRLSCEEGVEHLLFYLWRNTGAVVANPNFHTIAEVFSRHCKGGLIAIAMGLCFAVGCRIEAVRDEVEKNPCDVLWEHIGFASGRIKGPF